MGVRINENKRPATQSGITFSLTKLFQVLPGLPDGIFSNQNPNLGKFLRALEWKTMVKFMAIRNIYGHLLTDS
jgi:hypothetical protein